jgi:hypothetical protein
MKAPSAKARWVLLGTLLAVAIVGWGLSRLSNLNRLVIRNLGRTQAAGLHVELSYPGKPTTSFSRAVLLPGESWMVRHGYHDSRVALRFSSGGATRSFVAPYVDLWTGEGWVLEIQPDGSVKQGYDYPGHPLQ